jgi:hypothetical protein
VGGFVEYVWLDAFYMENAGAIHKSPSSVRFRANRTLISHGRRAAFDPKRSSAAGNPCAAASSD